ncbi:hypothetical protein [Cohnella sp. GCM10027633]|uniref:hypothetical protein n=1 Tax=unclassified Cohnella TaxID=2636738 RepID=UPI0036449A8B
MATATDKLAGSCRTSGGSSEGSGSRSGTAITGAASRLGESDHGDKINTIMPNKINTKAIFRRATIVTHFHR